MALLTVSLCLVARTARGEEIVRSIDWEALASASALSSGTVVSAPDGVNGPSLRVDHRGTGSETFGLLTLDHPKISRARYALKGRVQYEDVEAGSYFEMWNHMSEGAFFSRSLEQSGPMGRLDGSSPWREFVLPFFNQEGGSPPDKLVFNLVLTGPGTVEIGPLELVQFDADEDVFADSAGWWNDRQAGLIGGIVGSGLGILGAAIGWLGSTGRARGFVLGALKAIAYLGVGAVALGGLALASGQPYAVYYPLFLLGTITAALGLSLPRSMSKRYVELELRRMQALDA